MKLHPHDALKVVRFGELGEVADLDVRFELDLAFRRLFPAEKQVAVGTD